MLIHLHRFYTAPKIVIAPQCLWYIDFGLLIGIRLKRSKAKLLAETVEYIIQLRKDLHLQKNNELRKFGKVRLH